MEPALKDFLQKNIIAVIAVASNGVPHCFSCFYAWHAESQTLIFKSSGHTRHSELLGAKAPVAGCINAPETTVTKLQGLQFEGMCSPLSEENELIKCYRDKYPFAIFKPGEYWKVVVMGIKFTDNNLGFGKKIKWVREGYNAASFL